MANKSQKQESQSQPSKSAKDKQVSAVRHVGRTLESDPECNDLPSRAMAPEAGLLSRGGNDLTANPNIRAGSNRLAGTEISQSADEPEPLKTRLLGDTSSDPHTDVGADNATELQDLPDIPRPNRTTAR